MYISMKDILEDATEKGYAVIAANVMNMEMARGAISAADQAQAPLIIILGGIQMARHANGELMVPLIRTLAEATPVPIALCLDHGKDIGKVAYCIRIGFSSVMIDASAFDLDENIARTRAAVELCRPLGIGIEGEIGHVGAAGSLDGRDASLFTTPDDAALFVRETKVDCLAIAVGTAHGQYPPGFVPKIDFDLIRRIKAATLGLPLALHGSSGSGDDNILRSVAAGINKINVATEMQQASRDAAQAILSKNPRADLVELLQGMERAAYRMAAHWIELSGSSGRAPGIKIKNTYSRVTSVDAIYRPGEE